MRTVIYYDEVDYIDDVQIDSVVLPKANNKQISLSWMV